MGARTSIQFKNNKEISVAFFSHWDGKELMKDAIKYIEKLKKEKKSNISYPLERLEPSTVMVDFIRHTTKNLERVENNYYLGIDENDGDNSDYGHHIIDVNDPKWEDEDEDENEDEYDEL